MTEQNQEERNNAEGINAVPMPSQAEGDRETVEQDLREKSGQGGEPIARDYDMSSTPSQAEGDRETVERDIEQQSKKQR